MRRGAFVLIVVLSLAAVSAVVFTALSIGGRHITAWAMSQNASAGTRMTASLVRQVTIAAGVGRLHRPHHQSRGRVPRALRVGRGRAPARRSVHPSHGHRAARLQEHGARAPGG